MTNEHSQLLIDIQKNSKITVSKVAHLKLLKDEIDSETDKEISFNTLRRLFGFLPHTSPSQATLKTLANYLGFKTYSNYLNNHETYNEWYFQMKLLRLQLNDEELNKAHVALFNTALQNENHIIAVSNYVSFLIKQNNLTSLKIFFKYFDHKTLSDSNLSKFAILNTYSFYTLKKETVIAIYENLIEYDSFRNSVPLYFIDYRHLNGYYLEVLTMIKTLNKNASDVLFASLMLFYQKFYANEDYKATAIELPKNHTKLFPVLIGRYYGYKILNSEFLDETLQNELLDKLKTIRPSFFLVEIFPALIIKEANEFLSILTTTYYEQIFEVDRWSSQSTTSNYLIGLAHVNIHANNIKAAKINLELIELDKIELAYTDYITLFYYLTFIRLYHKEKNKIMIKTYYDKLYNLANTMGYVKFISVAEKYLTL